MYLSVPGIQTVQKPCNMLMQIDDVKENERKKRTKSEKVHVNMKEGRKYRLCMPILGTFQEGNLSNHNWFYVS